MFEALDISKGEGYLLLTRHYTRKELCAKRWESILHFLAYSCYCIGVKQRNRPEFLSHVIQIYNQQRGLCIITGQTLMHPKEKYKYDPRLLVSIDRLNNKVGYEIGNIQLTLHWVNKALVCRVPRLDLITIIAFLCSHKVGNARDQQKINK